MRERSKEAKPCLVGQCIEGVKQERGSHVQALPEKGRVGCSSGMGKTLKREGREVAEEEKYVAEGGNTIKTLEWGAQR